MKQEGDNNTVNKLIMQKPSCKMNLRAMADIAGLENRIIIEEHKLDNSLYELLYILVALLVNLSGMMEYA